MSETVLSEIRLSRDWAILIKMGYKPQEAAETAYAHADAIRKVGTLDS